MTNDEAIHLLEYYKGKLNIDEAIDLAIKAIEDIAEIKEAYESDYQIQDVIEVCVKLWG